MNSTNNKTASQMVFETLRKVREAQAKIDRSVEAIYQALRSEEVRSIFADVPAEEPALSE